MRDVGVVVSTYNRVGKLATCLDAIQANTRRPHDLLVVDDGSTDGTCDLLRERGVSFVTGENRGISWNKNRGLFHFCNIVPCRTIIIIEDDCQPEVPGWEDVWVDGALRWGHVNNAGAGLKPFLVAGAGTAELPFHSTMISGQCASFSHLAMSYVGYFDTRFGQYGHEHVEHTLRFLRAGYGGVLAGPASPNTVFYVVEGHIQVSFDASFRTDEALAKNGAVFELIKDESIHRWAWRSDSEMERLRDEMASATITPSE